MSRPSGADGAREPLGTASEEAARLADALQGWWTHRDSDHTGPGEGRRPDGAAGQPEHSASTCRYCPLCRGLAAAQSLRPEVVQHLLSAAESVAAALRELAAEAGPGGPDPGPDRAEPTQPRTVRIPVDDEGDGDDVADGDAERRARRAAQDL